MRHARHRDSRPQACEVIDFDAVLLDACSPEERADLLVEARLLTQVFARDGAVEELERMARTLSTGARDAEMGRAHARKLAAALRRLAQDPWG